MPALRGNNLHLLLFQMAGIGVVKIIHWEYEVHVEEEEEFKYLRGTRGYALD